MERGFRAMLLEGEGSGTSPPAFSAAGHSTITDACYSSMASQSFLSGDTEEKHVRQLLDYGCVGFPQNQTVVDLSSFGYRIGDLPVSPYEEGSGSSMNVVREANPIEFGGGEENWRKLKLELPIMEEVIDEVSTEPFDFISKGSESVAELYDCGFGKLPDLRTLEHFQAGEYSRKRAKPLPAQVSTFDSLVSNIQLPGEFMFLKPPEKTYPPVVVPRSTLARQRRQRISEKTRRLQKVLPWDKKMDIATMLGEAYKYIKFLQAQISVLQSMPCESSRFVTENPSNWNLFGGLAKLNRQQLLEVLVNSPVAQTMLSSQGRCVYSIEQVAVMKKIAARNALLHQMVIDSSMLG